MVMDFCGMFHARAASLYTRCAFLAPSWRRRHGQNIVDARLAFQSFHRGFARHFPLCAGFCFANLTNVLALEIVSVRTPYDERRGPDPRSFQANIASEDALLGMKRLRILHPLHCIVPDPAGHALNQHQVVVEVAVR